MLQHYHEEDQRPNVISNKIHKFYEHIMNDNYSSRFNALTILAKTIFKLMQCMLFKPKNAMPLTL